MVLSSSIKSLVLILTITVCQKSSSSIHAFQNSVIRYSLQRTHLYTRSLPPTPSQEQTYSTITPLHPLSSLIQAVTKACEPRRLDTTTDAHEAFRYEWGPWCDEDKLDNLMKMMGDIRLREGWKKVLLDDDGATTWIGGESTNVPDANAPGAREGWRRIRIAGGKYWDVILHLLPKNS